ncbi:MAG: cupin domain-containing protein [Candidatus Bathyarchaeia archaeon]
MSITDASEIASWEVHPGCQLKVLASGDKITLTYERVEPGVEIPDHKHPNEQIGYCLEGEATFKIGGEKFLVKKGYSYTIPSNVTHSFKVTGKQEFVTVDAFSPTRPDLLRKEFAPEKQE